MMTRLAHSACAILLAFLLILPTATAQDARGTIVGRVVDSTGALIPSTDIRVTNVATGVVAATKTNDAGLYTVPYLVPGIYTVTAELTGFKKFIRENVPVRVNDRIDLEIVLQVGDVTENIQITAEVPLLATAEASLGQVMDERRVNELPLFAGNAMDLVHLAPGVMNGTDMRLRKAPFNNAPSQFSADGNANYNNEFQIDGVSNTYSDGTSPRVAFSPPAASISEFRVQTAAFDAAVGHTQGALVNVATKGGTNELHGQAWWWLRHSKLDAPTLYQNRQGLGVPLYRDNRYGIASGGPVYIPGVYNGKNKTFWFFTFEGNKFGDPNVGGSMISTVPRDAWRDGNFSDLLAINSSYQLYDPATIATAPGGRFSRQPLPNNILPASRINAVGKALMNFYPQPNALANQTVDGRNNFFYSLPAKENYWTTLGRFDHAFSDKHRMFVRFHRDWWEEDKNRSFGNDVNGIILNRINRGLAMDQVYVFNPSFLLNFRYGFTQQEFPERRVSQGFDLSSLGFSQSLTSLVDAGVATIPRTAVGSLTTLSNWESGDGTTASLTHSFVGNFTHLRGAHNMRFGPEYRVYREFRNRYPTETAPDFSFSNAWARGPLDNSPVAPVGTEMVALLLGIPGGSMARNGSYAEQDQYWAFYFQDDWKVSSKLTLNLGMRAEYESPITERFDRSATRFFGEVANPIQAQAQANYARNPIAELPVSAFRVLGGLGFANVGGQPREYWDGQNVAWMPRIGFAYQINSKTVLRGGYGIFVGAIGVNKTNSNLSGFSQTTPIQASLDNGLTFIASLQNPLPNGLTPPPGASQGLLTNLNQGLSFFPDKRDMPYAQRWSLGIQRELPGGFMVENSYVGNRGVRLTTTNNINNTPAQYLSTSPVRDQTTLNFLGANVTSPFNGIPAPAPYGANISRANLLRPYPHFGGISYTDQNGFSWFHSMQTRLEKRFSKGYTLQVGYTWSKAMEAVEYLNNQDPLPYESISSFDRKHRVTGSGQWELPFGRNRKWGANWHPALNFIAGGWQLNGVMQRQSGSPLGFGSALFVGDSSQIALSSPNRNTDRWFNVDVFDSVAHSDPAVRNAANARRLDTGTRLRTEPLRYSNILTDSQRRWDFSAIKYFKMTERFTWQFRAETYNALNEVVLRGPNTDPYNAQFGRVTAQEPPRSWQMSLKLTY